MYILGFCACDKGCEGSGKGCYDGTNTAAEHAAEAARLGGAEAYRARLVNALLGAVSAQASLPLRVSGCYSLGV